MLRLPLSTNQRIAKIIRVLEILILILVCSVTILNWLGHQNLSPDSITYIATSNNLVKIGRLVESASYMDLNSVPQEIPFTEQPPGFPLFLAPFIAIFRDPFVSAVAAQSVSIALYYAAIYWMTVQLGFAPVLRVATLLLFAFLSPFMVIHNYLWTETLFIALSVAAGAVAVGLLREESRHAKWMALMALLALSSTVKFMGVINIILITPIALRRDSFRVVFRILSRRYVSLGLAFGGGILGFLSLIADPLGFGKPGIGPAQWRGIALGIAGLLVGVTSLLLTRNKQAKPKTVGLDNREISTATWSVTAVVVAIVPVLIWIARNRLFYGYVTQTHGMFESFYAENLGVPFEYIWNELLALRGIPRPVVAAVVGALLVFPFLRGNDYRKKVQIAIMGAGVAHFAAVWLLSLVARFNPLGPRLLSPALAFGVWGILHGVQLAGESLQPRRWGQLILAFPLAFLALSHSVSLGDVVWHKSQVNYPIEMQLWKELKSVDWISNSTHFYSDENYMHQIFSGLPQGIIRGSAVLKDSGKLRKILSRDQNPFILLTAGGEESALLEETMANGDISLITMSIRELGFMVYYLEE